MRPVQMDQTLWKLSEKSSRLKIIDLRVYSKAAPESDLSDFNFARRQAERGTRAIVQMQPQLNAHAYTSAYVIEARSITSRTGFAHGHNTQRLCGSEVRCLIFEE
jgi:hypothetical protein